MNKQEYAYLELKVASLEAELKLLKKWIDRVLSLIDYYGVATDPVHEPTCSSLAIRSRKCECDCYAIHQSEDFAELIKEVQG